MSIYDPSSRIGRDVMDILERYAVTVDEENNGCRHEMHHEPYTAWLARNDILDIVQDERKSAVNRVLQWVQDHGSGGGNWRRILWLAREAIEREYK